jgi:phosphoenolpyruvate carboxykinase (ATP)
VTTTVAAHDLKKHGFDARGAVHWNVSPARLIEAAVRRGEGVLTSAGAFAAITTPHTGRSPNDKFVVREPGSESEIWWGNVNVPCEPAHFEALRREAIEHLEDQELFVRDVWAGADHGHRIGVRAISPNAWHSLFVNNMFIEPTHHELGEFEPDWLIIHAPELKASPDRHGTRSSTAIMLDFAQHTVLIAGTRYAGEMKKSIFTVLNYVLPRSGVLSMHCSANMGHNGDVALFFGLSGTGKTTLSADPNRHLIGDDEHGWTDSGVFNFEGGNYAKVIRLSGMGEPLIWGASHRFGAILENVVVDGQSRHVDFNDDSLTENTRSSYPISFIDGAVPGGMGGHPAHVVFLTADAFGVMPPITRLSRDQAMYHFLSGYTAKVAGTERGVTEPKAAFSACFGSPFLPLQPSTYANLLGDKLKRHGTQCWLVNTGWTGGPYGTGQRMDLAHTRGMIDAMLNGDLDDVETRTDPVFGLEIPVHVPGVPDSVLDPRKTWADGAAYDEQAMKLAAMFRDNFKKFEADVSDAVRAAGPAAG